MPDASPAATLLFLREEELAQGLELVFFAQRDLAAQLEPPLAERGLGLPHGRVIQQVGRRPNLTLSELLDILRLPKQSVSRLIADLVERGLLVQRTGQRDRRQRPLVLTEAGRTLERVLWEAQRKLIARAYRDSGPQAVEGFRKVLLGLIEGEADRRRFERSPGAARSA